MKRLNRNFFERDPVTVAKDLLGCFLVRKTESGVIRGMIVETEAYGDKNDLASHARFGLTERNKIMYGPAGVLYVYHIYGIFFLSNIICRKEGQAGAVLLRSVDLTNGKNIAKGNLQKSKFVKTSQLPAFGPGKLSLAYDFTKEQNYTDLTKSVEIYLESKKEIFDIMKTRRVGVEYAGDCTNYEWRFCVNKEGYKFKK